MIASPLPSLGFSSSLPVVWNVLINLLRVCEGTYLTLHRCI